MEADDPIAIVIEALNPFQPTRDDTDNLYRLYQLFEGFRSLPDRDRAGPAMFSKIFKGAVADRIDHWSYGPAQFP
jgi:hypothetical protein